MTMEHMKGALVALTLVVAACGTISDPAVTSASATPGASISPGRPSTTATPQPSPTWLPGSVVRMSVNGVDYPVGSTVNDPGDGPVTVVLTFPFAVDRASVERWGLSGQPAKTWLDDRTLRLVFPVTEQSLAFKIPYVESASGDAVIDFFGVRVMFPSTRVVSVLTVAELAAAGNRSFPQTASSWRIRSDDGITLSPDAKRVLIYDGVLPPTGQVPTFIELDTKKSTPLPQPPVSDGWFSFADWMADGRLVMVGRGVWVGDANASVMKRIADAQAVSGGAVSVALPDPSERRVMIWAHNTDAHAALVELSTGAIQLLTGPFRRCVADGRPSFAWSADGRLLAGTDCDTEEGPSKARVRIVDVAADRTVRTIEGGAYWITGLPTGNFVLVRESGESGAGFRLLGLLMGFDGRERDRYLGHGWLMSRDGRYLLQVAGGPAGGPTYTMLDLIAGTSFEFGVPCGGRSEGGCPSPHWMRDGRLAFY
jgi:hypothetical protein